MLSSVAKRLDYCMFVIWTIYMNAFILVGYVLKTEIIAYANFSHLVNDAKLTLDLLWKFIPLQIECKISFWLIFSCQNLMMSEKQEHDHNML